MMELKHANCNESKRKGLLHFFLSAAAPFKIMIRVGLSGEYSVIIYQDMENNRKPNSVFENCNFTNHQTDSVIYIESGIATFINSIFTNNRAIESDGIVYIKECLSNFIKCIFINKFDNKGSNILSNSFFYKRIINSIKKI